MRSDCLIYGKSLPGRSVVPAAPHRTALRGTQGAGALPVARHCHRSSALIGRTPKVPSLREIQARHGIPVVGSEDVNDAATMALLRSLAARSGHLRSI